MGSLWTEDDASSKRKIIALWASPRTLSTPFERFFLERNDTIVFHEPFFSACYYSEQRITRRPLPLDISSEKRAQNYPQTMKLLLQDDKKPISFFKDMAFYSNEYLMKNCPEFFSQVINTFIIRDPRNTLISHYNISPDIEKYQEEMGFKEQLALFKYVTEILKQPAIVVDAALFCKNPHSVVKQYCKMVDIAFDASSVQWEMGKKFAQWADWGDWHSDVENSQGIYPVMPVETIKGSSIPLWLSACINEMEPLYLDMRKYAIAPEIESNG